MSFSSAGSNETFLRLCCLTGAALIVGSASTWALNSQPAAGDRQYTTTVLPSHTLGPVLTEFDHFAKPVSRALITGGRPQNRELAYLAAAGIQSVISVFAFDTTDKWNDVRGDWLSSAAQVSAAEALGMNATFFNSSFDLASVLRVSDAISSMPKPMFMHCHMGWTADLFAQLHLVRVGAADPNEFYNATRALGWDFQSSPVANKLVGQFGGPLLPVSHPDLEQDLREGEGSYQNYNWAHRLGDADGVYNLGQPLQSHVAAIANAGYQTVVSFRKDGEATTRLPNEPSSGPVPNLEFSDRSGNWNATVERMSFEQAGLRWVNLPVSGQSAYTAAEFDEYEPVLKTLTRPILSHCRSGHRSSVYMLAFEGKQAGRCVAWAVQRAAEVGFHLDQHAKILEFWKTVLGC